MNTEIIIKYLYNQKTGIVENYDYNNQKVKYSEKIKGWKINKFRGDEEIIRAYILSKLVNDLGYKPENIEIERIRTLEVTPSALQVEVLSHAT